MKIYDCFVFFNELKLLEFRLSMYYDCVDYFVLCECSKTQRGDDKPFYYEENKAMFEKYADKIIHVKADNPPAMNYAEANPNALTKKDWAIEFYQREQIAQGLKNAQANDLIIISDLDELYSTELITAIKENKRLPMSAGIFAQGKKRAPQKLLSISPMHYHSLFFKPIQDVLQWTPITFEQDSFYYFLNCKWFNDIMRNNIICLYKNFTSPQKLRDINKKIPYIKRKTNALGWHFSYLGGKEQIKKKLASIIEGDKAKIVGSIDDYIDDCLKNKKDLFARNFENFYLDFIKPNEIGLDNIEEIMKKYPEWFYNVDTANDN